MHEIPLAPPPRRAVIPGGRAPLHDLCRELFELFDDARVRVLTSLVNDAAIGSLSDSEAAAVATCAERRRREFASARALARDGLARYFGIRGHDLLDREDRSPVWPQGITGSISHCETRAWVALADAAYGTVGIDGEARSELG